NGDGQTSKAKANVISAAAPPPAREGVGRHRRADGDDRGRGGFAGTGGGVRIGVGSGAAAAVQLSTGLDADGRYESPLAWTAGDQGRRGKARRRDALDGTGGNRAAQLSGSAIAFSTFTGRGGRAIRARDAGKPRDLTARTASLHARMNFSQASTLPRRKAPVASLYT